MQSRKRILKLFKLHSLFWDNPAKDKLLVLTFAFIISINLVGKMIVLFAAQTFMLWEIYEM